MQKNKLLYVSIGVILIALLIFTICYLGIGIEFNTTTHAKWEQNGLLLTYKGSKQEIRKLEISRDGKTLEKLELCASPSLFSDPDEENIQNGIVVDSKYENTLILVPYSLDEDGDRHYRTLCLTPDGSLTVDVNTDVINPKIDDNGNVLCESTLHELIGEPIDELGAPYEESSTVTLYRADEERLCAIYQFSVIYYSESNIYCISESTFDSYLYTLGDSVDNWLSPDEYADVYDSLAESFNVPIPQKRS